MRRTTRLVAAAALIVTAVGTLACEGDVATQEQPAEETDGSLE